MDQGKVNEEIQIFEQGILEMNELKNRFSKMVLSDEFSDQIAEIKIKFRLPMFKPGWCEALATVSEVEERTDGVKVGAAFSKIDEKTQAAVKQYSADLAFLKDELRKATGQD